jgi:hypothetical protein
MESKMPQQDSRRLVIISDDGKVEIVGRWKIGELINAAKALEMLANNIEIEQLSTNQGEAS